MSPNSVWCQQVIKGVIRVAVSGAVTDALRMPVVNSGDSPRHGTPMSSMPLKSALDRLESEEEEDEVIAAASTADLNAAGGPGPQLVSKYTRAACFTSIGSICAGSLVGAVTPVLWALLRSLRVLERSRLRGCVVPLADMVEGVLIMSHKYAYPNVRTVAWRAPRYVGARGDRCLAWAQVAVYGKPWFQAARESWKAFNDRGLEAVVANDASDRVLLFICYAVGTVQAICAWVRAPDMFPLLAPPPWYLNTCAPTACAWTRCPRVDVCAVRRVLVRLCRCLTRADTRGNRGHVLVCVVRQLPGELEPAPPHHLPPPLPNQRGAALPA